MKNDIEIFLAISLWFLSGSLGWAIQNAAYVYRYGGCYSSPSLLPEILWGPAGWIANFQVYGGHGTKWKRQTPEERWNSFKNSYPSLIGEGSFHYNFDKFIKEYPQRQHDR